jgi:type II secretory pathway component PulF
MRRFPDVFSPLAVAVVTAGEEAGKLEEMLQVLAAYAEHNLELHRMLRRETFYPKILLLAIFTIVPIGLLIASAINPGLLGWTALIPIGILLAIGGAVGLGYLLVRSYQGSRQGRLAIDRIRLSLPVFGGLTRRIAMSRFCRALASLYSAGVGMAKAVDHAAEASANLALEETIRGTIPHVQGGGQLSDALAHHRLVPDLVVSMLRTGEQTGNIDQVLDKVADYYDDESRTKIHQLGQTIVPICVIIGAVVVLFIAVSFYLSFFTSMLDAAGG